MSERDLEREAQAIVAWLLVTTRTTQAQLARMLGRPRSFVSGLLHEDGRYATLANLAAVAAALGCRLVLGVAPIERNTNERSE